MLASPSARIIARAVAYCAQDRKDSAAMLTYTKLRGKLTPRGRIALLAGIAGFCRAWR